MFLADRVGLSSGRTALSVVVSEPQSKVQVDSMLPWFKKGALHGYEQLTSLPAGPKA